VPLSAGHRTISSVNVQDCLVVTVPGYISRGPRFDYRCDQIFCEVVRLRRGPLSFMITEGYLNEKVVVLV
jgi:hypothetical protein